MSNHNQLKSKTFRQYVIEHNLLHLLEEWDYEKNLKEFGVTPDNISHSPRTKFWWKCPFGHSYQSTCGHRLLGSQCPVCNQKRQTSFIEQSIYFYVKKFFPNVKNKYKNIFSHNMELDIFIPEINVGIEFDGANWHKGKDVLLREQKKYKICKQNKIKLIRIRQEDMDISITNNCDSCFVFKPSRNYGYIQFEIINILKEILKFSCSPYKYHLEQIVNLEKDANEIRYYLTNIKNSLLQTHPEIARQWHPTKNGNLTPNKFTFGSQEKVWWICPKCGREFKSRINQRVKNGILCPKCSLLEKNKRQHIKFLNTVKPISITHPEIARQWHPTKNGNLTPNDVTIGSSKLIWWKCDKGHEWQATCGCRKRSGCPYCAGLRVIRGETDIFTKCPDLKLYWDFSKNEIEPINVHFHSKKQYYWKCPKCGYSWKQSVIQMYKKKREKCPACGNISLVKGYNDLLSRHPEILKYWDYEKNLKKPDEIKISSSLSYHWKCPKCGYEWTTRIERQIRSNYCRSCEKPLHWKQILNKL